ncbi:hypothetical protein SRHO_G00089620 [Serrasalmus rhombeus]
MNKRSFFTACIENNDSLQERTLIGREAFKEPARVAADWLGRVWSARQPAARSRLSVNAEAPDQRARRIGQRLQPRCSTLGLVFRAGRVPSDFI